jgi:four helix bundle protein
MRDHKKLRAFELADRLALDVYLATRDFPDDERFGLRLQLRKGAVSVASNIVEGCARSTERDYVNFLGIAFGACCELDYQLSLSRRLGYLSADTHSRLGKQSAETARVLNGLIRSLRSRVVPRA